MNLPEAKFQIGKNGVTENVVNTLNNCLKTHSSVRISLLQGAKRDRESILNMVEDLRKGLNYPFSVTKIGFTLILKKQKSSKNTKTKRL